MKDLGDRMKRHESVSQNTLAIRTPVIIRLDGRAFHTFTRQFERPFDERLMDAMICAAYTTAEQIQGFKLLFTASDEVSIFLSDYDRLETDSWFDYNVQKIVSISAATMSLRFFNHLNDHIRLKGNLPVFDSRAFNVPHEDLANYFLWRQRYWVKNSVSAYASKFFSHKELQGKTTSDRHEMLYQHGYNWAKDVSSRFKNGTYIKIDGTVIDDLEPSWQAIDTLIIESQMVMGENE